MPATVIFKWNSNLTRDAGGRSVGNDYFLEGVELRASAADDIAIFHQGRDAREGLVTWLLEWTSKPFYTEPS